MSQSTNFFRKCMWIPFLLSGLFFWGDALGMTKIGLVIGAGIPVSLIVIMLISAARFGELNLRGSIINRGERPIAFYMYFSIFSFLGVGIISTIIWILLTWNL